MLSVCSTTPRKRGAPSAATLTPYRCRKCSGPIRNASARSGSIGRSLTLTVSSVYASLPRPTTVLCTYPVVVTDGLTHLLLDCGWQGAASREAGCTYSLGLARGTDSYEKARFAEVLRPDTLAWCRDTTSKGAA